MEENSGLLQSQNLRQQFKLLLFSLSYWDKVGQTGTNIIFLLVPVLLTAAVVQVNLTVSLKCEPPFKY